MVYSHQQIFHLFEEKNYFYKLPFSILTNTCSISLFNASSTLCPVLAEVSIYKHLKLFA